MIAAYGVGGGVAFGIRHFFWFYKVGLWRVRRVEDSLGLSRIVNKG